VAFFPHFYVKKNKILKIYAEWRNFQKWVPVASIMGDRGKNLHLAPGAQGALNSELAKSI
jgi:hypothetical protein